MDSRLILLFSLVTSWTTPTKSGVYEKFEADFLRPVLSTINLIEKEVIFCPGNHDVSHKNSEGVV